MGYTTYTHTIQNASMTKLAEADNFTEWNREFRRLMHEKKPTSMSEQPRVEELPGTPEFQFYNMNVAAMSPIQYFCCMGICFLWGCLIYAIYYLLRTNSEIEELNISIEKLSMGN